MNKLEINSLLFVDYTSNKYLNSILFNLAYQFSLLGRRVLYFAPKRLEALPKPLNCQSGLNADVLRLIRFVYPPSVENLVEFLSGVDSHPQPADVVIVEQLECFLIGNDRAYPLCALLFHAAETGAESNKTCPVVIASHSIPCPKFLPNNFFKNVILSKEEDEEKFVLTKLGAADSTPSTFIFNTTENPAVFLLETVLLTHAVLAT